MKRIVDLPPLPMRPLDGHKGLFGRVLVVGGHQEMLGAPVLAGTAALRAGSGLVQIAVPRAILAAALAVTPELIGVGLLPAHSKTQLLLEANEADVIVFGPGMGYSPNVRSWAKALLSLDKPFVVDADALNHLAFEKRWPSWFKARAVLTPHPGEMKRLAKFIHRDEVPTDDAGRIDLAITFAKTIRQIVVLKGHRTVVTDGDRVFVNRTGDSSLSKAGTGDVLSGLIGSLIGQKMDLFSAACAAVHIHGIAGELAGVKFGRRSVLARDVIDALPQAIMQYERVAG